MREEARVVLAQQTQRGDGNYCPPPSAVTAQAGPPEASSRQRPAPWGARHHDARFTLPNYVHVDDEDLTAGAEALGRLYGTTGPRLQLKIDNLMRDP